MGGAFIHFISFLSRLVMSVTHDFYDKGFLIDQSKSSDKNGMNTTFILSALYKRDLFVVYLYAR